MQRDRALKWPWRKPALNSLGLLDPVKRRQLMIQGFRPMTVNITQAGVRLSEIYDAMIDAVDVNYLESNSTTLMLVDMGGNSVVIMGVIAGTNVQPITLFVPAGWKLKVGAGFGMPVSFHFVPR